MQALVLLLAAAAEPAPTQAVDQIEVVTRAPVVGTLQQGVQAYRAEFFTPVRPGTAMDMIQWLPGFTFEDTRDLRGLGGAIGNVLIDGQPPTSKTDTLATVLRRIPASQVDRVDLIVGSAPGIDMRGRAVIANVVLKKTDRPKGSVTVADRQYGDGRNAPELLVTGSRKTERATTEGSLNLVQRVFQGAPIFGVGPLVRTDGAGAVLSLAQERARSGGPMGAATASHEFPLAAGKLRLNGSFRYMHAEFDSDIRGVAPPEQSAVAVVDSYSQTEMGARYERAFGAATLESQLLRRHNVHDDVTANRRPPIDSVLDEADTQDEAVARSTLRYKVGERLTLEGSGEIARNGLDTASALTISGAPAFLPAADVSVRETRIDAGGLLNWKPSTAWAVTAAARVETSRLNATGDVSVQRRLTFLKPRLVLAWTPDKRTQVRTRVEHEVTQLNFFYFVAVSEFESGVIRIGNPNLRPRRAWVTEAAIERQFWTGASVVATARYSFVRNVIDTLYAPEDGGATVTSNIGDGRRLDLIGTVTLPLSRLGLRGVTLKGTLNYQPFRVTDPTTGAVRQASDVPRWSGEAHLAHDLPRWKLNWGADLTYPGPLTLYRPTALERLEGFVRLTAFIEHRRTATLTLRLEGGNLTTPRMRQATEVYGGLRGSAPLLYADERRLRESRYAMVRLRKTLN